jgi:hypothetical protein
VTDFEIKKKFLISDFKNVFLDKVKLIGDTMSIQGAYDKRKFNVELELYKEIEIVLSSTNNFPIDYHVMLSLKCIDSKNEVIFTDIIEF